MNDKRATDVPFVIDDNHWSIVIGAGRGLWCGQVFDEEYGYSVALGFNDSAAYNIISAQMSRWLCGALRKGSDSNPDAVVIADHIKSMADDCERLNEIWVSAGKPAGGFENQPAWHA